MPKELKYDFGRKVSDYPMCEGEEGESRKKTIYPDIYIRGGKELQDLPDEGLMTVHFKVSARREENPDAKGETDSIAYDRDDNSTHSVEIVVMGATSVERYSSDSKEEKTEDAVDRLREEVEKES